MAKLSEYDYILVNSSGGKDSQAMLDYVCWLAEREGVKDRIVVVHADLGRVEWEGTKALAAEQASRYGVRFEVVTREGQDLLQHVEARGKWPGPGPARYCTSDHKRAPVCKLLTKLAAEVRANLSGDELRPARILNCLGLRAQEGPKRAKKPRFIERDPVYSNKTVRWVDTWLPIHAWTEEQVWATIRKSGVRYHWAYDLGMPRLSCCFCIFADRDALMLAGEHNPELLNEYVRVEQKIQHRFKRDLGLIEIQTALAAGERAQVGRIEWSRCA